MINTEEKLILENINLVYYMLKKLGLYNKLDEDYDIGIIGLVKAGKTYDKDKGYAFSSYACKCIYTEIIMQQRKINQDKRKANNNAVSLNKTVYFDGSKEIRLIDTIKSKIDIEKEVIGNETFKELYNAFEKLNIKELDIITSLYGINKEKITQKDLAKKYNITQASISRAKNRIIKKLRKELEKWR